MLNRPRLSLSRYPRQHPLLTLVLAAILTGAGFGLAHTFGGDAAPTPIFAEVVRSTVENSIGSLGTLEPKDYVDVGTQVSGQLDQLLVEIGDAVEKDQLLAEIDATVYESRVRNARSTLINVEAQLRLQKAELELAKTRARRNENLFAANAISRDSLLASQTELEVGEARIASLQAQLDSAAASLDGDLANLSYTKIYAPMSGTVVNASAIAGQTINASQTAPTIVRIANLDTMTVRAQVSEADVVQIQPGMPVYFTTLGMPDRRWQAQVRKVLPTPEIVNNVVLYNVLIDVDNSDRALMTSMTTQVFFVKDRAENTLIIPSTALRKPPREVIAATHDVSANPSSAPRKPPLDPTALNDNARSRPSPGQRAQPRDLINANDKTGDNRTSGYVQVQRDQKLEWRRVKLGVQSRTQVEVLEGLQAGDRVVTAMQHTQPEAGAALPRGRFR